MLLNEIATVTDISSARNKRKEKEELDKKNKEHVPKKSRTFKDPDEIGSKRRSKLSQADQFRDIARRLRPKDK